MPALQKVTFTVNVGSLRTDIDPRILPPNAGVLELENCVMSQDGALSKRFGNVALPTSLIVSGTLAPTWQLAQHQGTLLSLSQVGPAPFARYVPGLQRWQQLSTTAAPTNGPISIATLNFAGGATQANNPDIATDGNAWYALAYEYQAFNNLSIERIIDAATGKTVSSASPAGVRIKVVLQNGCFVYAWVDPSSHVITFDKWVIANLGTASPTSNSAAASAHATNPYLDLLPFSTDTVLAAYQHSDNTVHCVQYTVSISGINVIQLHDNVGATIAASQCLGWLVGSSANPMLVVADGAAGVKVHVFGSGVGSNATVSKVIDGTATTNVRNVAGIKTSGNDFIVLFETTGANPWQSRINSGLSVGGTITTGIWQRGAVLRSKPFAMAGQTYVIAAYDSTLQPLNLVMAVSSDPVTNTYPPPVARFQTWSASGKSEKASCLSAVPAAAIGNLFPSIYKVRLETAGSAVYFDYGVAIKAIATNDPTIDVPREANGCTWAPGGLLHCFDGLRYHEHTWHTYPEGLSVAFSNVGGGGLVAGQPYNWIAVYRWINAQGQIVRSSPSPALQATVSGGNNTATVTIPNCRLTSIHDVTPQIELYRTAANGTLFLHVGTTVNSFSASTDNAIVDGVSDANLAAGEDLYTSGGVLSSEPPPPAAVSKVYDRRLWVLSSEDRTLLWFSNQFVDGVAASFNEALTIRIRDEFGDVTTYEPVDDKLIIFKQNAIYAINGVGPDATGNGSYNPPQLIAIGDGVSANQVRSVVRTSDGIYFLAARGLCLLTRGLQVQFVGKPVQQYIGGSSGYVCSGSVLLPDVNQVRWFSDQNPALTIVYNLVRQVWAIFTDQFSFGQPTGSAIVWGGSLLQLDDSTGIVWQETPGIYTERGAGYAQKVTLPNLSLAGLRGYERLYRVQGIGACADAMTSIGVNFTYDVNAGTAHEQFVTPGLLWDWEARPARQTATTVKLTIRETLAGGGGQGFVMNGVTLVYGAKVGLRPVAKTNRAV